MYSTSQPSKRGRPQRRAQGLDEHLLGVVAIDSVDLAPLGEDRLAERQKCLAQRRGILPLSIHPLGRQPHDTLVARQNPRGHKGVLGAVAAEIHSDLHPPRAQRLVRRPVKPAVASGDAVSEGTVNDAFRCHPLPQDKAVVIHCPGVLSLQILHKLCG